jgi:hypothetical protein
MYDFQPQQNMYPQRQGLLRPYTPPPSQPEQPVPYSPAPYHEIPFSPVTGGSSSKPGTAPPESTDVSGHPAPQGPMYGGAGDPTGPTTDSNNYVQAPPVGAPRYGYRGDTSSMGPATTQNQNQTQYGPMSQYGGYSPSRGTTSYGFNRVDG